MRSIILILLGAFILISSFAVAEVPHQITYQGVLKDSTGAPVDDAIYAIKFRIYDDSTAGNILWETAGFVPVQTKDGLFQQAMGSTNSIPDSIAKFNNLWVGISVNLEPEMMPRTRLTSVPFSFSANHSDSSNFAQYSLESDSAQCAHNSLTLGGIERAGFIEKNEPNTIDSSMIKDGSISREDIGFSGFHKIAHVYANNTWSQYATLNWQDINALTLELDVEGDSAMAYLSLSIQSVWNFARNCDIRIAVDEEEVIAGHYGVYGQVQQNDIITSINMNQIVSLGAGHHVIKGQFMSPDGTSWLLQYQQRNLIAIILK
jgi:hypothetical protein